MDPPPIPPSNKSVKVHRVTLHKPAPGVVTFNVDPPLPDGTMSLSQPLNVEMDKPAPVNVAIPTAPISHFTNEKGEHVYEFQIPKPGTVNNLALTQAPTPVETTAIKSGVGHPHVDCNPILEIGSRTTPGPYTSTPPPLEMVRGMMDFTITDDPIKNGNKRRKCKVWLCKLCGKFFPKKANLVAHVYIHLGYRQHKCPACEKGFFHKSSLITHVRNECVFGKPTDLASDLAEPLMN